MLLLAVACSSQDEMRKLPNGDFQESTSSIYELPAFLDDKEDMMQNVYLAAAQHQDLLEQIPCYCGCGESAGHHHNLHCFIADVANDYIILCGMITVRDVASV